MIHAGFFRVPVFEFIAAQMCNNQVRKKSRITMCIDKNERSCLRMTMQLVDRDDFGCRSFLRKRLFRSRFFWPPPHTWFLPVTRGQ